MEKICKRCLRSWDSRVEDPKTCRWCKSPYWRLPVVRETVSVARKRRSVVGIDLSLMGEAEGHATELLDLNKYTSLEKIAIRDKVAPSSAGFGLDVGEFLRSRGHVAAEPVVDVGDAPSEDVSTKPWLPELMRLQRMGEMDPSSSEDEFNTLMRGETFRPPKGWANWSLKNRADWLDANRPIEI